MSLIQRVIKPRFALLVFGFGLSAAAHSNVSASNIVPVVQPRVPANVRVVKQQSAYEIVPVVQPRIPVNVKSTAQSSYEIVPLVQPRIPVQAR